MTDSVHWSGGIGVCNLMVGAGRGWPLLLALQSSRESREQMRGYVRHAEKHVHEVIEEVEVCTSLPDGFDHTTHDRR